MEDDKCLVYLPEDVAVKWNLMLVSNSSSEMCNAHGKSLLLVYRTHDVILKHYLKYKNNESQRI